MDVILTSDMDKEKITELLIEAFNKKSPVEYRQCCIGFTLTLYYLEESEVRAVNVNDISAVAGICRTVLDNAPNWRGLICMDFAFFAGQVVIYWTASQTAVIPEIISMSAVGTA